MAYNLLAELKSSLSLEKFNKDLNTILNKVELFPIHNDLKESQINSFGISLPSKFIDLKSVNELKKIILLFLSEGCRVFTLYEGKEINASNLDLRLEHLIE